MEQNFKEILGRIRGFVFDVDGVLTDGSLHVLEDGVLLRKMNIKDGYALQLAVKKGYYIFVISGSTPVGAQKRLQNLGITEVHIGIKDKLSKLETLLLHYQLPYTQLLYMGDDMPDLEVMQKCAIASCPADAAWQVKKISNYISEKNGGEGCVRDVIEQVLTLNGDWE
jgi:3-deoxy-D-manno-octulosonate 8-phosphate phosphatase (KDO 8-P phosphatase)